MYGALFALLITFFMIGAVIYKGRGIYSYTVFCKKSEIASLTEKLPDDAVIQIRIGGKQNERTGADIY